MCFFFTKINKYINKQPNRMVWNFFLKLLKVLVKTALEKASRDNFISIAFPAIGTGNLGIPSDEVANAMFEVVGDFSQSHPNATVKDVRFALKETKQPTFQVGFLCISVYVCLVILVSGAL